MSQPLEYELEVNGVRRFIDAPANMTLLSLLRERLGLTGTKSNCQQGECGACTVLIDGEAMDACLILGASVAGRSITTIEGVPDDDPVKLAFLEHGAIQCGYCTPGMVLAVKAYLDRGSVATPRDLSTVLSGNYCRCTGYEAIAAALRALVSGRETQSDG